MESDSSPRRWSEWRAAVEFGVDKVSLRRRLIAHSILPGPDGCFSTAQICQALFDETFQQKLRTLRLRANLLELKERELRGQLISVTEAEKSWDEICTALRDGIRRAPHLSREDRQELLENLQPIPSERYLKRRS